MVKTLPTYDKVFFVHYRCDNFNEGNRIYSLNIFCNDIAVEYAGNEVVNIKEYSEKVHELLSKGLTLVHWNQSHPAYGPDHVNQRYNELTGENLGLDYGNCINLAAELWKKYGDDYVPHPRLDNLAKLNNYTGIRETEIGQRTYANNRLLLLVKIYCNAVNDNLKISSVKNVEVQNTLHNHIFKGNAYELFERYHKSKELTPSSRTELSLLFQLLKRDGYFVDNIELRHYIKWLNDNYLYSEIELKKVNIESRQNKVRTHHYNHIKNNLKIT